VEVRIVSDVPQQAKRKLTRLFAGSEIKPKIIISTLKKLQGTKIKFEGIRIE